MNLQVGGEGGDYRVLHEGVRAALKFCRPVFLEFKV